MFDPEKLWELEIEGLESDAQTLNWQRSEKIGSGLWKETWSSCVGCGDS